MWAVLAVTLTYKVIGIRYGMNFPGEVDGEGLSAE